MTTDIDISLRDGIQLIRFTRAAKKNALTGAMYDAMSAALDAGETSTTSPCTCSSARAAVQRRQRH